MRAREVIERQISVDCLIAYGLWCLSIGTWAVSWMVHSNDLGRLSIILCGGAATMTIRTYFIAQSRRIRAALTVTGREGGSVRSVHDR